MAQNNINNIMSVWGKTKPHECDSGMQYYTRMRESCKRLASYSRHPHTATWQQVAAMFAILSPNLDEHNNWLAAIRCLHFRPVPGMRTALSDVRIPHCPGYPHNRRKAMLTLAGVPGQLTGPKVVAFYHNIVWEQSNEVTVDGHMHNIWAGRVRLLRGVRDGSNTEDAAVAPGRYADIAADFRQVASGLGIAPCQLQAVLWLTWKRIHNIAYRPPQLLLGLSNWEFDTWNGSQLVHMEHMHVTRG